MCPEQLVQGLGGRPERDGGLGVGDRRFDLAAMANDPLVREQTLDVVFGEAGNAVGIKIGERGPEGVALAEDREPRQA
jgi:hypothetical protein